jgi:hypothetical protein
MDLETITQLIVSLNNLLAFILILFGIKNVSVAVS